MIDWPSLAEAGRGVDLGGRRIIKKKSAQGSPVIGLADRDVARRQVREHGRAGQRAVGARWDRQPQVLADLDVHRQLRQVGAPEQQVRAERDVLAEQSDPPFDRLARGAELAFLVVLEVFGQVALGHHAED